MSLNNHCNAENGFWEHYTECIQTSYLVHADPFVLSLRKIFDEDNYAPMSCEDEGEYDDLLKKFPFDTEIHGTKVLK